MPSRSVATWRISAFEEENLEINLITREVREKIYLMELEIRGLEMVVTPFGYRDNRYIEVRVPSEYNERWYYSVPEEFQISEIDDVKIQWSDPQFRIGVSSLDIVVDGIRFYPLNKSELPFPVGDYSFVDHLLEIAQVVGLELSMIGGLDEIKKFVEEIKEKVKEGQRLLTILNVEPIMNLAKQIDQRDIKIIELTDKAQSTEKKFRETSERLRESESRVQSLEKRLNELEQERITLKEDFLGKLKKAVSEL